jgi:beta-glucanase (GH16 family)
MLGQSLLKKILFSGLVFNSVVIPFLVMQQPVKAESFSLVWSTEFDKALNRNEWNIYNNAPFATSQTACFSGANTYTRRGKLNLVISRNRSKGCHRRPYLSGGLDTYTYRAQTYGKWEVRAKMPAGHGVVGYIGLFPVNGSWPPEVDFAEYVGKDPGNLFITQHYGTWPTNQQDGIVISETSLKRMGLQRGKNGLQQCVKQPSRSLKKSIFTNTRVTAALPVDVCAAKRQELDRAGLKNALSTRNVASTSPAKRTSYWTNAFHTYTLEWVPGEFRYYIDGILQAKQPQKFTATPDMMKLAIGTGTGDCGASNWIGCPTDVATSGNTVSLPTQMQVDSIKIYKYVP